jgi:hypothetical protein
MAMTRALVLAVALVLAAPLTGNGGGQATAEKLRLELEALRKELAAVKADKERSDVIIKALTAEVQRARDEAKLVADVVKDREQKLLALTQQLDQERVKAVTAENTAKAALERAQKLLETLRERELTIARLQAGGKPGPDDKVKDPAFLNPPAAFVKGTVVKVDPNDKTLIKISLGSDHGLKADHTLEVYRLRPQPMYLGRVRVLEAFPQEAIGRLIRPEKAAKGMQVQEGDEVASQLK